MPNKRDYTKESKNDIAEFICEKYLTELSYLSQKTH